MSTTGTNGNDTLVGTNANESISGGNGNDRISGGGGNDILSGGNGQDTIDGGAGNDTVSGGNGDDILDGGAGSDRVVGDNGNDTAIYVAIDNVNATDVYDGGNGFDTLVLELTQAQLDEVNASTALHDFRAVAGTHASFDFSVYGFSFDLHLTASGFEQIRTVVIADPNPAPVAHADANTINEDGASHAVAGNVLTNDTDDGPAQPGLSVVDAGVRTGHYGTLTLNPDGSYSYLLDNTNAAVNALNDGEALTDIFSYTATDGVHGDSADLTITIAGHTDPALFTPGNDVVVDFNAVIAGTYQDGTQYDALAGDDWVILPGNAAEAAEAGYVIGTAFHAGEGQNTVLGGALDDTIIGGSGADRIDGGAGNDIVSGGGGYDILDGGAGINRVLYDYAGGGIHVDLAGHVASVQIGLGPDEADTIVNFQEVVGSSFRDIITGDDNDNSLFGMGGDDIIEGGGGADRLEGGDGRDWLLGQNGDDTLVGGSGSDTLDGGDGTDTADYSDSLIGIDLNLVSGTAAQGMDFERILSIENVVGSRGDDVIVGDDGANRITGFLGNDTMTGGAGADVFHFDLSGGVNLGNDVITDFEIGVDQISLAGSLYHGLADLNPQQVGQDTVLDLGHGTLLTLLHTNASLLANGDFIF